ncbi:MAG: uncharacterized protein K0S95_1008 [Pantoea eucrina]|nr:uncharacterized protein [Pantoea eucrina]
MSWFTYAIAPIDWNWDFMDTVEQTVAKMAEKSALDFPHGDEHRLSEVKQFINDWEQARNLAYAGMWEGDYREPPKVFWIPDDHSFTYAFVWKQDNNGTTFIVSPVPLPHLEKYSM